MKLIRKGAEANIYKSGKVLIKDRIKKGYRVSQLDEFIRKRRTKKEAKLLQRASRAGVLVPKVLHEDKFILNIEFIEGERIKDVLNEKNYKEICKKIGESVAKLHKDEIIHGDLTTSNIILKSKDIYFIDFGLGFFSRKIEDKATDLHLLEEAFESTHFKIADKAFDIVLKEYKKNYEKPKEVLKRLEDIRKRGRYVKR